MNYFNFPPRTIRETSQGLYRIDINDLMFQNREIWLTGDIDESQANNISCQLLYLAEEAPDKEITMYINSPGGSVSPGLAIYDVMRAIPCQIRTVCFGTAASMAAVLFAAGDRREILRHSEVMIHDPLVGGISGSALSVQDRSERLMAKRKLLCSILAQHTGKELKQIYKATAKDTWFGAEEAVKYGLADAVIDRLCGGAQIEIRKENAS